MLVKVPKMFLLKNVILDDDMTQNYKEGLIEIDDCIANEIIDLWEKGIHTRGCCCGHGVAKGFIQVERTDLGKMINMGYEWYHDYSEEFGGKERRDAFIPKTICRCKLGGENNDI